MTELQPTLLIVDDTPDNIELLVGVLRDSYRLLAARDGDTALRLVRQRQDIDLILLDVMMPGIDGYEVCRQLKADETTRHIPVIFITARISVEDEVEALEIGAIDFISKPISPPVVRSRVRTHLALANQNRELDRKVREQTTQLSDTRLKIVHRLGRAAEFKDNETGMHVVRMSHYSRLLGLQLGMGEAEAELLLNAAPMHDIGKIGIPDAILRKPGKLDPAEWEVMKTHSAIGAEIIGDDDCELLQLAAKVALGHHEKWDGSGYPQALRGEAIPRVARIVAIADVFDALTSERPYKHEWPVSEAVAYLRDNAGSHFDPQLVGHFLQLIEPVSAIKARYADRAEDLLSIGARSAPQLS